MSEIICPFCGAANSIEALTCFNCKKQLYDDVDPDSSPVARDEMDWLNDFRGFADDPSPTAARMAGKPIPAASDQTGAAEEDADVPEWLARIRALKDEESPIAEIASPELTSDKPIESEQESELPEWIKDIKEGDVVRPLEEPAGEIPEWLNSMASQEDLPPAEDIAPDFSMISDETGSETEIQLPDLPWDLPVEEIPEVKAEIENSLQDEVVADSDALPDDLFEILANQPDEKETDQPAQASVAEIENRIEPETPEIGPQETTGSSPLPEWMFEPAESKDDTAAEPAELDFSTLDAGLATIGGENLPADQPEAGLPDWLLMDDAANFGGSSDSPAAEAANIEVGQMPGWLHAMRPLEAAAPELPLAANENRIEPTGPLAGYQGVLPGESIVTHYSRPPVYSDRVQVTDKQRIYATLFETLIADETRVGTPPIAKNNTLQLVLRTFVGLILIGAILLALIFNPGLALSPTLVPPEAVVFYETVQLLTTSATPPRVLVGLDYEPALSGELSTISSSVIEDWFVGNSGLAFVSLNLSGPALASDLVDRASANVPGYLTAERVINLGYLPGGASALAALAADPSHAAPSSVDGIPAWNSLLLQGMVSVSDFDAVLLLTDNTENTRAWIEQVKPAMDGKPLLVVSSAQAAPALQPFVQSGQITGMISGFTGGAAYEQLTQAQNGTLRSYWDAYQGGMLLIAAFMLIGSLIFGILALVRRSKKA